MYETDEERNNGRKIIAKRNKKVTINDEDDDFWLSVTETTDIYPTSAKSARCLHHHIKKLKPNIHQTNVDVEHKNIVVKLTR